VDLDISDLVTETFVDPSELIRELVPLNEADLVQLSQMGPSRSMAGLKKLKARHHIIALRLASGMAASEICIEMGLTPQTITRLQKDPQFVQLIEDYTGELVSKAVDQTELMSATLTQTITAIYERLTDDDERALIPIESLRKTLESLADRTGHSPVRRSETLSHNIHELSRDTISRIKGLHAEDTAYETKVIDAQIVSSHEEESKSNGAALSIADAFKSVGPSAEAIEPAAERVDL
jgi:hypothetical protein